MKSKTFSTHTLGIIITELAIELSLNVWLADNTKIKVERMDYFINQRINKNGTHYEELTLFILYSLDKLTDNKKDI